MRRVRTQVLLAERAVRPRHRYPREYLGGGQLLAQLAAHGVRDRLLGEVLSGHARPRAHRPDLLPRLDCNKPLVYLTTSINQLRLTRTHTYVPNLADSDVMTIHRNSMPGM